MARTHHKRKAQPCTGLPSGCTMAAFFKCIEKLGLMEGPVRAEDIDLVKQLVLPVSVTFVISLIVSIVIYKVLCLLQGKEKGKKAMIIFDYIVMGIAFIYCFLIILRFAQ